MSGLETAIRNALDRADRTNAEIRARVYQSARQALETGLRKQDVSDPETVALQRQRLEATIRAIETEERARLHAAPPVVAKQVRDPAVATPRSPERDARREPQPDFMPESDNAVRGEMRSRPVPAAVDRGDLGGMRADRMDRVATGYGPVVGPAEPDVFAAAPEPSASIDFQAEPAMRPRRRRRGFFTRLFVYCVLIAFIGIGGWWVLTSGLLLTKAQRDTSVANPPATAEGADFNGNTDADNGASGGLATLGPQAGFSDDWIQVFVPGDISKLVKHSGSDVEVISGGDGPTARITSRSPGDDGTVEIEISPEILRNLAGKRSTVALTLQSSGDKPTQISVQCDFASLGDCDRHRFTATQEKSDALFQVTFDRSLAPSAAGHLVINSDIEGKGRGVNLFAVRILPGQ